MDWLNNANTIASLIAALIGIGGFVYGDWKLFEKEGVTNTTNKIIVAARS